eukprot:365863_1
MLRRTCVRRPFPNSKPFNKAQIRPRYNFKLISTSTPIDEGSNPSSLSYNKCFFANHYRHRLRNHDSRWISFMKWLEPARGWFDVIALEAFLSSEERNKTKKKKKER